MANKQPLYEASAPELQQIRERASEGFRRLVEANTAQADVPSWIDENRVT